MDDLPVGREPEVAEANLASGPGRCAFILDFERGFRLLSGFHFPRGLEFEPFDLIQRFRFDRLGSDQLGPLYLAYGVGHCSELTGLLAPDKAFPGLAFVVRGGDEGAGRSQIRVLEQFLVVGEVFGGHGIIGYWRILGAVTELGDFDNFVGELIVVLFEHEPPIIVQHVSSLPVGVAAEPIGGQDSIPADVQPLQVPVVDPGDGQAGKAELGPGAGRFEAAKHCCIPFSEMSRVFIGGAPSFDTVDVVGFVVDLELDGEGFEGFDEWDGRVNECLWTGFSGLAGIVRPDSVVGQPHDEFQVGVFAPQSLVNRNLGINGSLCEAHHFDCFNFGLFDEFIVAVGPFVVIASMYPYAQGSRSQAAKPPSSLVDADLKIVGRGAFGLEPGDAIFDQVPFQNVLSRFGRWAEFDLGQRQQ